MNASNLVVGLVGASVVALALAGIVEIDARAGPYEQPLTPAAVPYEATGSYRAMAAEGTTGPGGICVPDQVGGACREARTIVELSIQGLPHMGDEAAYVAFLAGAGVDPLPLGALTRADGAHGVQFDEPRDATSYRQFVVTLETDPEAQAPGPLRVYARDVAGQGRSQPLDLAAAGVAIVVDGQGLVRLAEIGAMSKSVTAVGQLSGAPPVEGWTNHLWFASLTTPTDHTYLGPLERTDDPTADAVLDARVEHLRLEDQRQLLITLVPEDSELAPSGPIGFPAFSASIPTER
jgi:hypothetical protein